ncbi:MAG TPA: translation initiation factor IF-2 [Bacteroidales bacterium]|nr:translation initiation factor IF-2 [Bacteroidales bacterium]
MSDIKTTRLSKIARELNVGISTIVEFLHKKGVKIDSNPNEKITSEQVEMLLKEFNTDLNAKKESEKLNLRNKREKMETVTLSDMHHESEQERIEEEDEVLVKDVRATAVHHEPEVEKVATEKETIKLNVLGKIDMDKLIPRKKPVEKEKEKEEKKEPEVQVKPPKPVEPPPPPPPPPPTVEEIPPEPEKPAVEEPQPEVRPEPVEDFIKPEIKDVEVKVVGKIDLDSMNQRTRPPKKTREQLEKERRSRMPAQQPREERNHQPEERPQQAGSQNRQDRQQPEVMKTHVERLNGPKVVGKINLPGSDTETDDQGQKKKRKRIKKDTQRVSVEKQPAQHPPADDKNKKKKKRKGYRFEISEEDVDKQIKDTYTRLTAKGKSKGSKYRREKRDLQTQRNLAEEEKREQEKNILKVTEFVTVNELATMMDVPVNEVIAACMSLGLFVSINQRLDAEALVLVAEEFDYKVEFVTVDTQEDIEDEEEDPALLVPRPPIVTVMGHVDHGKTKLLDHIRHANVIAGEAGGITQHIGAYGVELKDGRKITFLDTPGHEAFTAMRARGAQITDVAIIVVAADDGIMPQTTEAINHAQAAGVPMVFAINKIDKPTANPEKIKEHLAKMNILVEDWGGKFQSQEISAKTGLNVEELLEKVLLEAEMLNLKANPDKGAVGTIIESSLDKGRGYIATVLVQAGTLSIGDIMLAGHNYGRVKAMYDERGKKIISAGPSDPVLVLGLNGAPQAGDKFNVYENDKEAKDIATKREQLLREQGLRTQKHITLDEIGRRIAIGNFKELNVIVKGDVDGSIEALSDSLIKLSNEEIQVNVIHKAVGQISESDVLLAAASNAIVIGFQVRPSLQARKLAEKEEIDIRLYSIIYDAINELKSAMEGMLSPEIKEEIVATLEILETFKITKVGTIAGCMVKEGKIRRDTKVRIIRDGIVIFSGMLASLKRYKDDVKEAVSGQECGLNIENYNDIRVGDIIEGYETTEVKKKL